MDDLPKKDKLYTDLKWFEQNAGGVMPLEIVIDTKKKNGVRSASTLKKIEELKLQLEEEKILSNLLIKQDCHDLLLLLKKMYQLSQKLKILKLIQPQMNF